MKIKIKVISLGTTKSFVFILRGNNYKEIEYKSSFQSTIISNNPKLPI